jgi:hypothetical protein
MQACFWNGVTTIAITNNSEPVLLTDSGVTLRIVVSLYTYTPPNLVESCFANNENGQSGDPVDIVRYH